jgi:hypothetical protein
MSPRPRLFGLLALEALGVLALIALVVWLLRLPLAPAVVPATVTALVVSTAEAHTPTAATATRAPAATATRPAPTPSASPTLEPSPTHTPTLAAQVIVSGQGLRLRASPGTAGEIIIELDALSTLQVVGRTEDGAWLQVITASGANGWVSAAYVEVQGDPALLAVTGEAVMASGRDNPYLSGITANARAIWLSGRDLGNRDFAFSMVGDSNTDNPAFLLPFDLGAYRLGDYADLQLTIDYFKGSFARDSAAARGGFSTAKVLDPGEAAADGRCQAGESPLACEYRLHRPSAALILLGTGDQHTWQGFEARYRQIIQYSLAQGVIPVLITKADDLESLENTAPPGFINAVIRRLAAEYDVPLLDLRAAVDPLPNRGCLPDGFHYNAPPDGRSADFDAQHLQYGYTVRNLTALQALDALRQYVLY